MDVAVPFVSSARVRRLAIGLVVLTLVLLAVAILPPYPLLVWLFLASVAGSLIAVAVAVFHLLRGPAPPDEGR